MSRYCTYRTTHPSGFYYTGKGLTEKVSSGTYKGSGVRFKLALQHPGFEWDSWTTAVLSTHPDEEAAYEAEALLVPLTALRDPFCLNAQAGGRKGRGQNHARLHRMDVAAERREKRAVLAARRKARAAEQKAKLTNLRQKLRKTR